MSYVDAPVARGLRFREVAATIGGNGHVMVVKHRELIADVSGSTGFAVTGYPVNPGQGQTFPWLSVLARNFEKYRFRRLRFEFESSQPTTAQGMTMLAFDLDASDPAPASKLQLMSYQGASRANVWEAQRTSLPEQQPPLYVRVGTQPVNTDIKTYDAANLWFGTSGEAGVTVIGELYVEYEVELHVPQLQAESLATGGTLTLRGTTATLVDATATGSLEWAAQSAIHLAFRATEGQAYVATFWCLSSTLNQSATLTTPSTGGQVVANTNLFESLNSLTGTAACTSCTLLVNQLTDSTYALGSGWAHLTVTYITGVLNWGITISPIQVAAVRSVPPSTLSLMERLAQLELRLEQSMAARLARDRWDSQESSDGDSEDDTSV